MNPRRDFPSAARLRRPEEFRAVMKGGRRVHQAMLTAIAKPGATQTARLGLAISARSVPRALDRNRIKRLARESFRATRHRLAVVDIVIVARDSARNARGRDVAAALDAIWKKFLTEPQA